MPGLACPNCGRSTAHGVTKTQIAGQAIRRRRRCRACKTNFHTVEILAATLDEIDGADLLIDAVRPAYTHIWGRPVALPDAAD